MRNTIISILVASVAMAMPVCAELGGVDSWPERLSSIEREIEAERFSAAAERCEALIGQMVTESGPSETERAVLAKALGLAAVAELELGREEDALWHWQIAQNLDPELSPRGLAVVSTEISAWLADHELRGAEVWPRGVPTPGPTAEPAVPIAAPNPEIPRVMYPSWEGKTFQVEVLIDSDGRVREPVVLTGGELPGKVYLGLEAIRKWRFRPARTSAGEAVASFLRLTDFEGPNTLAFRLARSGSHQPLHELLLTEKWREALDEIPGCAPEELLAMKAVAAAGAGNTDEALWSWAVAQSFRKGLPPAWLEIYGREITEVFTEHPMPCPADPACRIPRVADEPEIDPPVQVSASRVELPSELVREIGSDRLIAEIVVDADGGVRDPVMRAGHSQHAAYLALEALRDWRFEPARRQGEPLAVRLEVTIPVEPAVSAEKRADWTERLGRLDLLLAENKADMAFEEAAELVDEIANEASTGGSDLLAHALTRQALAEAGLGRQESAVWHWQMAQNLAVQFRVRSLEDLGPAGELLARHRLPWPKEKLPAAATARETPRWRGGEDPDFPKIDAELEDVAVVRVVLDEEGRPRSPVVLRGRHPGGLRAALEAIATWRYEVPGNGPTEHEIVIPMIPRTPLRKLELERNAERLADLALDKATRDPESARCYWRTALNLDPGLLGADLRIRDEGAQVLATASVPADRWGPPFVGDPGMPLVATVPSFWGDVERPSKTYSPQPKFKPRNRFKSFRGGVVARGILDEEGRLRELEEIESSDPGLEYAAIETFCTWRYQPATLDGEPVAVRHMLSLNYRTQRRYR